MFPIDNSLRKITYFIEYPHLYEFDNSSRGWLEGSCFISYYPEVKERALLLFLVCSTYFIILSAKQGGIKYQFRVFGMTLPEFEHSAQKLNGPTNHQFLFI